VIIILLQLLDSFLKEAVTAQAPDVSSKVHEVASGQ